MVLPQLDKQGCVPARPQTGPIWGKPWFLLKILGCLRTTHPPQRTPRAYGHQGAPQNRHGGPRLLRAQAQQFGARIPHWLGTVVLSGLGHLLGGGPSQRLWEQIKKINLFQHMHVDVPVHALLRESLWFSTTSGPAPGWRWWEGSS